MGIYTVKSKTCNCIGDWCTLTNDTRIHMQKPCELHSLATNNKIWYNLNPLLGLLANKQLRGDKTQLKVLQCETIGSNKKIIKVEVNNMNGIVFDESKQRYFSQINDEPMWKWINNDTIHFILLYNPAHHKVEDEWIEYDY